MGTIIIIVVLVTIVLSLLAYNIIIYNKLKKFEDTNQRIQSLNVLQEFMSTIGEEETVENKITKINNILIEKYDIKYSTIVVFDGAEYVIKATNVSEKHWETMRNLQSEEIFKDSIMSATPKYVTVNNEQEKLPYQKVEFGRAKSAIFFPLYIENIYIGYWIIESGVPHAFDNIDTTILEVVKDNIISVLKTVSYQATVESLPRKDLYSELTTGEYLYGKGKRIIDKYITSSVCMFKITNLENINITANRETGNNVITEISRYVKESISSEYIFVRYMGPKFVLVFSGIDVDGAIGFLQDLKNGIESLKVDIIGVEEKVSSKKKKRVETTVSPNINTVVTTYYKGTALESVTQKLEEYLDSAEPDENDINEI